jgi:hypothetical protein
MDSIALYLQKLLKAKVIMGIRNKYGLFIAIPNMQIDSSGNLFYLDNKRRRNVSSLVFSIHGLTNDSTNYWFEYLYFIDKNTNIISFKNYMENEIKQNKNKK